MLTTRGFRHILHIVRHKRPYDFFLDSDVSWQSQRLVEGRNRIPVRERILTPIGVVEVPLDEGDVLAGILCGQAGGFHVGPPSAVPEPGPACYGRGGEEPTVTDAQVVLDRLDPDLLLGGDLRLDPNQAAPAIRTKVAEPLGLSLTEAALGIIRVVNSNMALAICSNSVARGLDPRHFSIMPFGGATPLHGVALAKAVCDRDVIVPVAPGITGAVGLPKSDLQYEQTETLVLKLDPADILQRERLDVAARRLLAKVAASLRADGIDSDR